jgi:thymidylate kinase
MHLVTPQGSLICFTGIDGSGKTTQARLLVDWLTSRGVQATYTWSRGEVLAFRRIFLSLGRKALGTSTREIANDQASYREYQSRKSRLMGNALVRTLWSVMTYAEHVVQINTDIRRGVRAGSWVVCDRYQWDTLIDLAVLNRKSSRWLVNGFNMFMWRFLPSPPLTFLIDIPAEEAMRRKDDIPSLEYVQTRRDHYLFLANKDLFKVIDGCRGAADIHREIASIVEGYMEGRAKL